MQSTINDKKIKKEWLKMDKHYYHYYCESLGKNLIINHLTTCFRVDSLPPSYGTPISEHDFELKLQNVIALGYLGIPGGEF